MQLKNITCKTELQLMSIRSKHWKNISCSLGINMAKIQLTSVVNHKWEMKNYEITQDRCTCFLFTWPLLLYYLYMLYVAIQTNIVDFIFNYIKKKKPSVFPNHFIILVICHKNATRTGSSLTLNFMNYTYFSQSRYSQCFKNCVYSV